MAVTIKDVARAAQTSTATVSKVMNGSYSLIVKSVQPQKVCEFIRQAYEMQQADGFVIHASVLSKELDELIYELSIPHLVIGNPNFASHFC